VRLAILAVVMSVVSLFYYIRFIRAMYIEPETEPQPVRLGAPLQVALGLAALLVLYIGIFPQRVIDLTEKAARTPGFEVAAPRQTEPTTPQGQSSTQGEGSPQASDASTR
jgi:formate hydrogenlyase subunit 3/multisubunit Na+/H+ antiporter MnhD subunit